MKAPSWRRRSSLRAKTGILRLSVYASFAWASGTRPWPWHTPESNNNNKLTVGGVQKVRALQVNTAQVTRCVVLVPGPRGRLAGC